MELRISGRHFEITDALKEHVKKKTENFEKYLHTIIDVHAILSIEKYRKTAEISVLGKKLKITEKSVDTDMFASIDKVCTRIEKTLRRHKDKIKTHRGKSNVKSSGFVQDDISEERG
ncbi:MAG: ribosome-associated translation inhibitor RaiA [Candidatus Omnitrophica bacterium]|nr:ribosome-associated translation inhibitor RaiA [Candidatus Omnitrophota bacterium]